MTQSMFSRVSVGLLFAAAACALLPPTASYAAESECPLKANQEAAAGPAIKPQINLEAVPATEVLNFGGSRGIEKFYAVFKASSPLPKTLTPDQLEITVPRPPRRVSDNLESASLPFPTFGTPTIIDGRREIQILTCIDASDSEAGTYTGQIALSGPSGLTGASVTTTINAKNEFWFWAGLAFVLAVGAGLLYVLKVKDELDAWWQKAIALGASALIAGAAMWGIYDKDPAWGADIVTSIIALAGAGFGAIGVGNLVSPIVKKVTSSTGATPLS